MKDKEPKRRGPKEKPVPERKSGEYNAAEQMRLARQQSGKTLSEAAERLHYTSQHLSRVETGRIPITKRLARQYEQLFGREPGKIVNTVFERPRKSRKQQKPPTTRD
jgi:transcriptional regulator with XRE-family HTH domain